MKILNLYYSQTGNTKKVARRIAETLEEEGFGPDTVLAARDLDIDLLSYDMVFVGSGVYQWLPGKPMLDFLRGSRQRYADSGAIRPCAPRRNGKRAVVYCTYAGVHTGIHEAIPAVKFTGQLFDHLGFAVVDEWYIVGDFQEEGFAGMNAGGRYGTITGRPDEHDLVEIAGRVSGILRI